MKTVAECLAGADSSVAAINDINTHGNKSFHVGGKLDRKGNQVASSESQSFINAHVKRNVDHLSTILAYTNPDVAGSSEDKSSYTNAIAIGKQYLKDNSEN